MTPHSDIAPSTVRCEGAAGDGLPQDWFVHLRTLAYDVTVAEARERRRLANELHDGLGQLLAIAQMRLGQLGQQLAGLPEAQNTLGALHELLAEAAAATRSATYDLHSPLLQQLGLRQAIEGLADRLSRQGGPRVMVDGPAEPLPLADAVQAVVLRVVRELLHNAYKHAQARYVGVRMVVDREQLTVVVGDDGIGFDPAAQRPEPGPRGGFGLPSVQAQLLAVGGRLDVYSQARRGTQVTLVVPLSSPARGRSGGRPARRTRGSQAGEPRVVS